ncbi:MAG TPA: hypothetical protein VGL00_01370, partial [Terracidiphilus sp.]
CRMDGHGRREHDMPITWSHYNNPEDARKAIEAAIPKGTSRRRVEEFITQSELTCFDKEAEILACRFLEPSSSMVKVTWSLAFYFNEKRELDHIVVNRGLTGP